MKKLITGLVLVLVFNLLPEIAHAQTTADISITPTPSQVTIGNNVVVSIDVSNVTNFGAYDVVLHFDPTVLQVPNGGSAFDNAFLTSTGNTASPLVNSVDNTTGTVHFAIYTLATNNGPTGSGRIATVQFNTFSQATTQLTLSNITLSDITGTQIPFNSPRAATVRVVSATTPSPSPSSSPVPSPSSSPVANPSPSPSASPGSSNPPNFLLDCVLFQGVGGPNTNPRPETVTVQFRKNGSIVQTNNVSVAPNGEIVTDVNGNTMTEYHSSDFVDVSALTTDPYNICIKGPSQLTKCYGETQVKSSYCFNNANTPLLGGNSHDDLASENGVEKVGLQDYAVFSQEFVTSHNNPTPADYAADFNFDGRVDIFDYSYIVANFDKVGD